jgi:hypothetical protein
VHIVGTKVKVMLGGIHVNMCQLLLRLFLDVLHVETQVHHTLPPSCVFSLFFMLIWFVNLTWDYLCFRCLKGSKSRLIPQGFDWGTRFADRGIQSKTTSNLYAWVNLKSLYACYVCVSFLTMHPPFGFRLVALLGVDCGVCCYSTSHSMWRSIWHLSSGREHVNMKPLGWMQFICYNAWNYIF